MKIRKTDRYVIRQETIEDLTALLENFNIPFVIDENNFFFIEEELLLIEYNRNFVTIHARKGKKIKIFYDTEIDLLKRGEQLEQILKDIRLRKNSMLDERARLIELENFRKDLKDAGLKLMVFSNIIVAYKEQSIKYHNIEFNINKNLNFRLHIGTTVFQDFNMFLSSSEYVMEDLKVEVELIKSIVILYEKIRSNFQGSV